MSVPLPDSSLDGRCSAVNDGILYVLSSDSFQSLPLKENATWSTLSQGVVVSNPACIKATPGNDTTQASLYVIGGTSTNSSYTGVQRYIFSSNTWETIDPPTTDLINRTNHSVATLPNSNEILVYAGSQPDAIAATSSQTFTLALSDPYKIIAYTSDAPPGNQPILLNFDDDNAILMGSGTRPKEIWTFNTTGGWSQYATSLSESIGSGVRGLIIDASNGSKVLTTYDATVAPNLVSAYVLENDGEAPTTATAVKRELSLSDWPTYNSTDAPTTIRSDYGLTSDESGLVVLTGGASGNPLNLFNYTSNAWVDNGLFFDGKSNGNKASATTTSGTNTATASAAASSSAVAAAIASGSSKSKLLRDLGITLGVLFALAALFIIGLLLLRYRRQKQRKRREQNEKQDHLSFQDRGLARNDSTVDISKIHPNHRFTQQNDSRTSFAFMAGKLGSRQASRSNLRDTRRNSTESTRQLVNVRKENISKPVELDVWAMEKEVASPLPSAGLPVSPLDPPQQPESVLAPEKVRSTGWSRYFAAAPDDALPSAYNRGPTVSAYTVASEYTVADGAPPVPTAKGRGPTVSAYTVASEYTVASDAPPVPSAAGRKPTVSAYTVASEYTVASDAPPLPDELPSSVVIPEPLFGKKSDEQRASMVLARSPPLSPSLEYSNSFTGPQSQQASILGQGPSGLSRSKSSGSLGGSSVLTEDEDEDSYMHENARSSMARPWTPIDSFPDLKTDAIIASNSGSSLGMKPRAPSSAYHDSPDIDLGTFDKPRAPSSTYTASFYGGTESRIVSARGNPFFPSIQKESYRPKSRGLNSPLNATFPAPAVPVAKPAGRESTLTTFPKGVPSGYYAARDAARMSEQKALPKQDMSWLNLGG